MATKTINYFTVDRNITYCHSPNDVDKVYDRNDLTEHFYFFINFFLIFVSR